jgi:NAD(P)H-dependent flavin oxidoreductase YrpB (nitropropane dioxygenase family)
MRTGLTGQYGIEYPIIQAALGVVSMPALVAAVSEAGGMGTLGAVGASLMSPSMLRCLILAVRSLTERPFGVNFVTPFATDDHVRTCIETRVPVVSFHMGEPPHAQIERLRESGARVWLQVGSVEGAREAVRSGADAVIAQGSEAGGANRSVAAAMTLVPAVVDAVTPVPVIAAGGIADGRGLVAALALGAEAVWVGTRFVASREANAHEEYKRRIVQAGERDTMLTSVFSGYERYRRPVRALSNRVVREWTGREDELNQPREARVIGLTELGGRIVPMHAFSTLLPTPETSGEFEEMCLLAGESAALIADIRPAGEIVRDMMHEARRTVAERLEGITRGALAEA